MKETLQHKQLKAEELRQTHLQGVRACHLTRRTVLQVTACQSVGAREGAAGGAEEAGNTIHSKAGASQLENGGLREGIARAGALGSMCTACLLNSSYGTGQARLEQLLAQRRRKTEEKAARDHAVMLRKKVTPTLSARPFSMTPSL